jgi:hypothetical protein
MLAVIVQGQLSMSGTPATPGNFTIFEGTSEIQWVIIGRAVTGLPVR